jgi:hypothetical protein
MQSTDSGNRQTRSIPNDHCFAPFGKSSASVHSKCNPARLDRALFSEAQIASVENTLPGRTIGDLERDYVLHRYAPLNSLEQAVSNDSENTVDAPVFFYRATLFDSVMDFLDRYDHTAIRQQSIRSER